MAVWNKYKNDEAGSFAVIAAVTLGVILVILSAALEIGRMSSSQSKLQSITDMAVLAGAVAADNGQADRKDVVKDLIEFNLASLPSNMKTKTPSIEFDDNSQTLSVKIHGEVDSIMSTFLGGRTLKVSAESESLFAPESLAPISIAFALDVSGSMSNLTADGDVKISTLQDSIPVLFESLEAGTKDKALLASKLRTGMSAYNTELIDQMDMDYGWEDLSDSVDALVANGGTNSVPALQNSYDQLLADRSFRQGKGENIDNLVEYVIFMTDGDNNQPQWDEESAAICEAMKSDGIKLYSIAFAAPEKGEALLLDCASSNVPPSKDDDDDDDDDDDSKCMNNGSKGKGKALGHCKGEEKEEIEESKSKYYFDASDAEAFEDAFDAIGESIATVYIRIL